MKIVQWRYVSVAVRYRHRKVVRVYLRLVFHEKRVLAVLFSQNSCLGVVKQAFLVTRKWFSQTDFPNIRLVTTFAERKRAKKVLSVVSELSLWCCSVVCGAAFFCCTPSLADWLSTVRVLHTAWFACAVGWSTCSRPLMSEVGKSCRIVAELQKSR